MTADCLKQICSKQSAVKSGIIKGNVLGLTLFTLYVNGLPAPIVLHESLLMIPICICTGIFLA